MRRVNIPILMVLLPLGAMLWGATPEKTAAPSSSMSDYKIVMDRNVFNRFREPVVVRPKSTPKIQTVRSTPIPVNPTEYLDLTGVMLAGGTARVFFEGTSYGVAGVFELGDVVGGYRIFNVTKEVVSLEKGDKRYELPVGKSLTWSKVKPVSITERELSGYYSSALSASAPGASSSQNASINTFGASSGGRDKNSLSTNEFTARVNEVKSRLETGRKDNSRGRDDSRGGGDPPSAAGSSAPKAAPSAADRAELLRKMMERRRQQETE